MNPCNLHAVAKWETWHWQGQKCTFGSLSWSHLRRLCRDKPLLSALQTPYEINTWKPQIRICSRKTCKCWESSSASVILATAWVRVVLGTRSASLKFFVEHISGGPTPLCVHSCTRVRGPPVALYVSRYTYRSRFPQFLMCSSGIALHLPLKALLRLSRLSPFNCQGRRTSSFLWKGVALQGGVVATLAAVGLHCATMSTFAMPKQTLWENQVCQPWFCPQWWLQTASWS